ncbi:type II toxin-antitoxin system MqsR family toxin [Salmonella enterica]|nr:type II toxin-antitoxin system MqsR family toxin [Salmonella enterica subsp. salamae]EEO2383053.1 type II toxin-antitoxin system MqsR family toxin [Salmonella enterica]ECI4078170.1 type II toxin-antitoxin system MqsR family toxin [Salmonella enterica subsp. salamae]EJE9589572.1 type II toxin-antitoxin system MqsR family toxin [Salmonella enterica]EJH8055254.1 type II toxin-antitoxin system MqsR family toxin [Salmonella enterica]
MVDKWTPHTDLETVKDMVRQGKRRMTISAYNGAAAMGFGSRDEMYDAILALTPADFHKSMEAEKDPGYWQEVYRPTYLGQQIYLKFIVKDDVVIVSFKEK